MSEVYRVYRRQKTHMVSSTTTVEVNVGSCNIVRQERISNTSIRPSHAINRTYLTRNNAVVLLVRRSSRGQGDEAEAYVCQRWSHRGRTGLSRPTLTLFD